MTTIHMGMIVISKWRCKDDHHSHGYDSYKQVEV